jgi:diketogulonate reductase-like aldo/keto reductase
MMEYKVLNNGLKMPMVGLGVYNISDGETQRVVENAVSVGVPDSERHCHYPKDNPQGKDG